MTTHRGALILPLAICAEGGAHGFHLSGDLSLSGFGVVGILAFQCARRGNILGIIREGGHHREELGHTQTALDFLVDVVAVIQLVGGRADLGIRERVQLGRVGADRRVVADFIRRTVNGAVDNPRISLDSLVQLGITDGVSIGVQLAGLELADGRVGVIDAGEDHLVHPGTRAGRRCCGWDDFDDLLDLNGRNDLDGLDDRGGLAFDDNSLDYCFRFSSRLCACCEHHAQDDQDAQDSKQSSFHVLLLKRFGQNWILGYIGYSDTFYSSFLLINHLLSSFLKPKKFFFQNSCLFRY